MLHVITQRLSCTSAGRFKCLGPPKRVLQPGSCHLQHSTPPHCPSPSPSPTLKTVQGTSTHTHRWSGWCLHDTSGAERVRVMDGLSEVGEVAAQARKKKAEIHQRVQTSAAALWVVTRSIKACRWLSMPRPALFNSRWHRLSPTSPVGQVHGT